MISRSMGRVLPLTVLVLLAGCLRPEPPAPVEQGRMAGPPPAASPSPPPRPALGTVIETAAGRVTVKPGETLYKVAREAGVPLRPLIDANELTPPYRLKAGQVLVVPATRQYLVAPGDTLLAVARRFGVEASSLARINHLDPPFKIKVGLPLTLPAAAEPVTAVALAPLPTVPPTAAPASAQPAPPPFQPAPIPPGPPPSAPPAVVPPPVLPTPVAEAPKPPPPKPAEAPPPKPAEPAPPPPAAQPAEPEAPPAAPAASVAVAEAVANHRGPTAPIFYWPVRGRVVAVFGPAAGGTHNDGINIQAPAGTTVAAADSGVVAYAGNELRGFGNLLLIKHADGWVTAYAHNQVLLVAKGDHVRRGQAIAQVGSTGNAGSPQLHFELRNGTKAVDPLDHLPPLTGDQG